MSVLAGKEEGVMSTQTTTDAIALVTEIEAAVLDAPALDRLADQIRKDVEMNPYLAEGLLDRIARYRSQLAAEAPTGAALMEALGEKIATWPMFNDLQQEQIADIWQVLGGDDASRLRWLRAADGEGFTRLAKVAQGDGDRILAEARLANRLADPNVDVTWA